MSEFVVDASVAAKWFFREKYSELARGLLDATHDRIAPDFLIIELASVATKRVWRDELDADSARAMLRRVRRMVALWPSAPVTPVALEIAVALRLSAYDSVYLALAAVRRVPLVTADRRLFNAARHAMRGEIAWIEDVISH